jgi:hypothetical protein
MRWLKLPVMIQLVLVSLSCSGFAQTNAKARSAERYARAVVVDDRLSALRSEAGVQSRVLRRLRLFIIGSKGAAKDQPRFYRVAVTRRTRGWIHESALAVPGRPFEDERVIKLIATMSDPFDRVSLCRLFLDHFGRSPLAPRALLLMAEESDAAAASLSRRAAARLEGVDLSKLNVRRRDLYLSDPGLDRYSRLRLNFGFDEATGTYVYDGQAYRELIRRFPTSPEAERARAILAAARPARSR